MQVYRSASIALGVVLAASSLALVYAQQQPQQPPVAMPPAAVPVMQAPIMPLAPPAAMGAAVTPAYEGWFQNTDGTFTMILGYHNRNQVQVMDIPIGPNNRIEPGGPDQGQPTHFLTGGARSGRQYGVFSITVPKDFGTKKLTWTLISNGQTMQISPYINPPYVVAPFFRSDNGNSPPIVKVMPTGPELSGPPRGMAQTLTGTVNEPVTLTVYAIDTANTVDQQNQFGPRPAPAAGRGRGTQAPGDTAGAAPAPGPAGRGTPPAGAAAPARAGGPGAAAPGGGGGGGGRGNAAPVTMFWSKFRGTGEVKFAADRPTVTADPDVAKMFSKQSDFAGKATTTATFSAPGEYIVRGQVNDASGDGGGGNQCCWTNILVKVNVRAR